MLKNLTLEIANKAPIQLTMPSPNQYRGASFHVELRRGQNYSRGVFLSIMQLNISMLIS